MPALDVSLEASPLQAVYTRLKEAAIASGVRPPVEGFFLYGQTPEELAVSLAERLTSLPRVQRESFLDLFPLYLRSVLSKRARAGLLVFAEENQGPLLFLDVAEELAELSHPAIPLRDLLLQMEMAGVSLTRRGFRLVVDPRSRSDVVDYGFLLGNYERFLLESFEEGETLTPRELLARLAPGGDEG